MVLGRRTCDVRRTTCAIVVALMGVAWPTSLPADGTSQIYVYALRDTAARSWIAISCGNIVVAELKQGTYFIINEPAGQYMLFVEKGVPLSIDTRTGGPSFIRLDWNYGMGRPPIPVLATVRQRDARKEIKYLSYINSKRVHPALCPKVIPLRLFSRSCSGGMIDDRLHKFSVAVF
jgi:hypothetical protein